MTSTTRNAFRCALLASAMAGLLAGPAMAQTSLSESASGNWVFGTPCFSYNNVDDFIADLNGRPFELEDYEGLPFEMTIPDGTVVNGVTYNFLGDFGIVDGLVGNQYSNLGSQSLYYDKDSNGVQNPLDFWYANWGDKLVVTFPGPVRAAGMHISVGTDPVLTDYVIMAAAGNFAFSGGGAELHSPPGVNFFFVGLICDEPFTQATFYCRPDAPTGFNLDNLYWVPAAPVCVPCDTNCDTLINAEDIEPFIGLLFDGTDPCCGNRGDIGSSGDINLDGMINAEDIEGFIGCLFP